MDDVLARIELWYESRCDGAWEHQYGVRIDTIDNPGWRVEIDLKGTPLIDRTFDELTVNRTESNWLRCRVREGKFEGFCGPRNLKELLLAFLAWTERSCG